MLRKVTLPSLRYIVLLSFLLKIGLYCFIGSWNKTNEEERIMILNDSKCYEELATNLLEYHTYASPNDTARHNKKYHYKRGILKGFGYKDALRLPCYPTFLGLVYIVAGIKPFIAILIQILLSLISVVMVYRIAMLLFNNKNIASLASLLFSLDIHSIYEANKLLTDTLFVMLFLVSFYYFIRNFKEKKHKNILISAVFMGVACLTRPVILLYPVVLISFSFLYEKESIRYKIKSGLIFFSIVYLFTGIWCFRNHCAYGTWQLTTQGGKQLLMYNVAATEANRTGESMDSIRIRFQDQCDSMGFITEKNPFKQSDIYTKVGLNYVIHHKVYYVLTQLEGGVAMFFVLGTKQISTSLGWSNDDYYSKTFLNSLVIFIFLLEYIGCIYGIIRLIASHKYIPLAVFLVTASYYIIFTGATGTMFERYKLPVIPFICIIAGYGYYQMFNKARVQE